MIASRTILTVTSATALVVGLVGCAAQPSASSAADPARTLTIGVSSIQSGSAATSGLGMKCAVEAYLDAANEAGGVNGYTFEVVSRDHQYDPARAATIAREFVGDGVFAMVTDGTATMKAALPAVERAKIPIFATADGALFTPPEYPAMFGINPDYAREAASGAKFILDDLGETSAGLAYLNSEAGKPASESFPKYMTDNGGSVAATVAIAATATDFTPYAQSLKASGTAVVYSFLLDTQLASLQKASDAIGFAPKWVSWFPAFTKSYLDLAGPLAEGTYMSAFSTPLSDTTDPGVAEYLKVMTPHCPDNMTSQSAMSAASFADAIVNAVGAASADGQEVTQTSFVSAMAGSNLELGVTPSVTWSEETHAGATQSAMYQIADSTLVSVTPYEEQPNIK